MLDQLDEPNPVTSIRHKVLDLQRYEVNQRETARGLKDEAYSTSSSASRATESGPMKGPTSSAVSAADMSATFRFGRIGIGI